MLFLGIGIGILVDKTTIFSNIRIPFLQIVPTPTQLAVPTTTLDPTADWSMYTSSCGFSVKYPDEWSGKQSFLDDINPTFHSCAFLSAPDYQSGLDSRTGFWIEFTRLAKGTSLAETLINSEDDYFQSTEDAYMKSSMEPLPPLTKEQKTYGMLRGIQFDISEFESITTFVFTDENNIWLIKWPTQTQSPSTYRTYIDQILSTFAFTEQLQSCTYKGKTYASGESFPDECNSCSCEIGQIACTMMACQ